MESGIHSVESGIQDSLGLPYMGRVRHVFVEFVEKEVGGGGGEIWNPESGIRNSQPFAFCYSWKIISHLQYFFVSVFF